MNIFSSNEKRSDCLLCGGHCRRTNSHNGGLNEQIEQKSGKSEESFLGKVFKILLIKTEYYRRKPVERVPIVSLFKEIFETQNGREDISTT
jgi:hypothetical protein